MTSSLPKPTLQQQDPRSFPDSAPSNTIHGIPSQTLEGLAQNVDDYQSIRTKKVQDLVLNVTRLAWQECSGAPSSQSHAALLETLDELKLTVESKTDTVLRLIYQPPQNAGLRTVVEMGLFRVLLDAQQANKDHEVTADQLAAATGSDKGLVVRLMRLMTSLGLCTTTVAETYTANSKTSVFGAPIGQDGVRCIYDLTLPAMSNLHNFLSSHNYSNLSDYNTSPMQWAVGKGQFEWLAERPEHQRMFDSYMANRRQGKKEWFEVYPFHERLIPAQQHEEENRSIKQEKESNTSKQPEEEEEEEEAFIVDVGGNHGHNLQRLVEQRKASGLPGRLILQDLPGVIDKAPQIEGVEQMPYSFFQPQPVHGARIYFFRAIFHDWPDQTCHQILSNTVSAMNPTTSRIIIVDHVLSDIKASLIQTSMDIQMMSIGSGMERSFEQWKQLLTKAGLEIRGIWWGEPGLESVIEAGVVGGGH